MYFWEKMVSSSSDFLITDDETLTYENFNRLVANTIEDLSRFEKRSVVFILMDNSARCVSVYISCLKLKIIPLLLPENTIKKDIIKFIEIYKPSAISTNDGIKEFDTNNFVNNENVALLLSTSGSTGSPKLVALSYDALQSNAESICEYLSLNNNDRGFCSMPLSYSYGLSILNSHLNINASIVLTNKTPFDKDFIFKFESNNCTSISGVPFLHEALLRTGFYNNNYPSLRMITQAGGNLKERFKKKLMLYSETYNKEFFVMYGQTEATARISYVPPHKLKDKMSSIGIAIPGGNLRLSNDSEIIYSGENVMMGYVETFDDFAKLKALPELRTGDLGYVDEEGYFFITGRAKRFIKIAGFRYNLDEIELHLSEIFKDEFMVDGDEDLLKIFVTRPYKFEKIVSSLQKSFRINGNYIKYYEIENYPINNNGKKDYKALKTNGY